MPKPNLKSELRKARGKTLPDAQPADPPPGDLPPIPGHLTPDAATRQVMTDVVAWADEYGRTKLIAEAMTTLAGQPISRQMVGRWLNGTATPNMGTGLLLLAVVRQLQQPRPLPAGQRVLLTISLTPTQP